MRRKSYFCYLLGNQLCNSLSYLPSMALSPRVIVLFSTCFGMYAKGTWRVYKRWNSWWGDSASVVPASLHPNSKLESFIYKTCLVCATPNYACPYIHTTTSCLPHFLFKATMLYTYALTLFSGSFYHVLGLWHHIMWLVM